MDFYLFISQNSKDIHSKTLPKDFYLEGVWEVALSEIRLKTLSHSVFFCANFVDQSAINNIQLPVLRQLFPGESKEEYIYKEFSKEQFYRVNTRLLRYIELYLCDQSGIRQSPSDIDCVLHFRWSKPT